MREASLQRLELELVRWESEPELKMKQAEEMLRVIGERLSFLEQS